MSLFKALIFITILFTVLHTSSCKKSGMAKSCPASVEIKGNLIAVSATSSFRYKSGGGVNYEIDNLMNIRITYDPHPVFKIELFGETTQDDGSPVSSANHENFNHKHIKDRAGNRRSIIFPDGSKVTIVTEGESEAVISITIYDGNEVHRIMEACRMVSHSSITPPLAQNLDAEEADGETSAMEPTSGGLLFVNIYTETSPGNKIMNRVKLAEMFDNNPNQVFDHYDDPRLQHT